MISAGGQRTLDGYTISVLAYMIKNISVKTAPNGRTPPIIDIKIVCKNLAQQILWSLATSAGKSSEMISAILILLKAPSGPSRSGCLSQRRLESEYPFILARIPGEPRLIRDRPRGRGNTDRERHNLNVDITIAAFQRRRYSGPFARPFWRNQYRYLQVNTILK